MKKLALVALGLLVLGDSLGAQSPARTYSRPAVPAREILDRLNLNLAWYSYLPVDGYRDGLFSMQILENQLLVLMRSGEILSLDAASGAIQWRTRVGQPYVPPAGFGSNARSLFVAKGVTLYALDRSSGNLQWEFGLPAAPSASPVVDDERF